MTGSYAEDIGGYGGPSDEGAAAEGWRLAQRLDGAREAFVEASESPSLLAVLLAPLSTPEGGDGR